MSLFGDQRPVVFFVLWLTGRTVQPHGAVFIILTYSCRLFSSAEAQLFKSKFFGWDDILAVDYTLSADYVSKVSKQLGTTVSMVTLF